MPEQLTNVSSQPFNFHLHHIVVHFQLHLRANDFKLNPRKFMRVNRKYIVPLTEVEGFERDINGKERLILKEGVKNPVIVISRDNKRNVHNWIDGMHTPQ